MVALPKYVRPVTKSSGRTYHYFERGRGTAAAWPRIPLLADPLSELFAIRVKLCECLEYGEAGFRFIDVGGRRHDLPAPSDGEVFWAAVSKADEIGKRLAAGDRKVFSALIVEFKESAAYNDEIGDVMRSQYDRYMPLIEEAWGDDPVAALTPEQAQRAIDEYKDTPAAGRLFRATMSRLISWGIPRGYRNDNPILSTEKMDSDGTYEPWPTWAFELFFEKARIDLHLPVYSGLFTGQRKVDVLQMLRPKAQAAEMPIVAQKTDAIIPVQIHSEYRAIISSAKADHVMLHLRRDGEPWTYEGFKTAWQRQMDDEAFAPFKKARLVFHGLRKNAVNLLLEVGCSEAQVSAIVGMSLPMVVHYSQKVSRFRLARGAMKQLEQAWDDIRKNVLGSVRRVG